MWLLCRWPIIVYVSEVQTVTSVHCRYIPPPPPPAPKNCAKPVCGSLCRQPKVVYVLEALTPKACQEDVSYERFELLGDAFLKYAVSIFLFHKYPEAHEGTHSNPASSFPSSPPYPCSSLPIRCTFSLQHSRLVFEMLLAIVTDDTQYLHGQNKRLLQVHAIMLYSRLNEQIILINSDQFRWI